MKTTFGQRVMDRQEGMLRAFTIRDMVRLDEWTGDGRLLKSSGAGVRSLPRTVFGGFAEGDGHGDNVVIGRLDAVEFDPESNTATGYGWLLDDDNGRQAARYIGTGAMTGNSIHMAEVEVSVDIEETDDFMWELKVTFEKWSVASTTMLGIPAFKDSQFSLEPELVASFYESDEPLVVEGGFTITFDAKLPVMEEITASAEPRPPWEYFHRAEDAVPTPITVGEMDGDGWIPVFGNLARWNVCHDGIDARCVIAPYDPTEYAGFNCSSVLSNRGRVPTGPIFFKGGHPDKPLGDGDVAKAYGGIENAWADVRVTHGVHGPWISGVVRPGMTSESIYAARASRISGHWMGDGRLKAIVSCNSEGYNVPDSRVYTDAEGAVLEVVASFVPDCQTEKPVRPAEVTWPTPNPASMTFTHAAVGGTVVPLAPWAPGDHSHGWNTNQYNLQIDPLLTFDFVTPEARRRTLEALIAMLPETEEPTAAEVDVTDADAVARYLAELDLEAEEDADLGLV
jgi:hypothetical protein